MPVSFYGVPGGGENIARVTKEQIKAAKEWDLLTYLQQCEPNELVRSGGNEYCTRSHDSLKISHGLWCWNSREIGGRSALDYLIKVRGVPFVEAVERLCALNPPLFSETPAPPPPKKPFRLPAVSVCPSSVVPYLQGRGIDAEIISACLNAGILYESRKYKNCVFVGKNPQGEARFACLRGTRDNFKQDVAGSDKRFSFFMPALDAACPRLAVAESPIDALSLATLVKRNGGDWRDCNYLSLGGTAPRAMLQYLYNHPQITQISLCLDNDEAGERGMDKLEQAVRDDPELSGRVRLVYRNPPPKGYGKDYNEFLLSQMSAERTPPGKVRENAR